MHTVDKNLITEVFLHFCDIDDATVCKFLEFGVVDICTVKSEYLVVSVMARGEHERVVSGRRSKPNIAWNAFVGMDDRVHLEATFLLSCLGMPANAPENGIGEKRDGRGINDAKLFYPFFRAIASAVRGNYYFCSWLFMVCLATPK